jgi:hypothetical protein
MVGVVELTSLSGGGQHIRETGGDGPGWILGKKKTREKEGDKPTHLFLWHLTALRYSFSRIGAGAPAALYI